MLHGCCPESALLVALSVPLPHASPPAASSLAAPAVKPANCAAAPAALARERFSDAAVFFPAVRQVLLLVRFRKPWYVVATVARLPRPAAALPSVDTSR